MELLSIISYCVVEENNIYKDGKALYKHNNNSPETFPDAAYSRFGFAYPKFYKMDHLSRLGWLASEVLLKDAKLNERYDPQDISIVLCNSSASLDADIHYAETMHEIPSPALFVYTLPNIVIGEIAISNGFKGENAFFVSESFDAALLRQYVEILFTSNTVQACLCGWAEVVGGIYKCVLFLIEKEEDRKDSNSDFSVENLEKIFAHAEE